MPPNIVPGWPPQRGQRIDQGLFNTYSIGPAAGGPGSGAPGIGNPQMVDPQQRKMLIPPGGGVGAGGGPGPRGGGGLLGGELLGGMGGPLFGGLGHATGAMLPGIGMAQGGVFSGGEATRASQKDFDISNAGMGFVVLPMGVPPEVATTDSWKDELLRLDDDGRGIIDPDHTEVISQEVGRTAPAKSRREMLEDKWRTESWYDRRKKLVESVWEAIRDCLKDEAIRECVANYFRTEIQARPDKQALAERALGLFVPLPPGIGRKLTLEFRILHESEIPGGEADWVADYPTGFSQWGTVPNDWGHVVINGARVPSPSPPYSTKDAPKSSQEEVRQVTRVIFHELLHIATRWNNITEKDPKVRSRNEGAFDKLGLDMFAALKECCAKFRALLE